MIFAFWNEKEEETSLHLFWNCGFSEGSWNNIIPAKQRGISIFNDTLLAHLQLPNIFFARGVIILGCWHIWTQRNGKIFRNGVESVNCWKFRFKEDLTLQHRTKVKILNTLKEWIGAHL